MRAAGRGRSESQDLEGPRGLLDLGKALGRDLHDREDPLDLAVRQQPENAVDAGKPVGVAEGFRTEGTAEGRVAGGRCAPGKDGGQCGGVITDGGDARWLPTINLLVFPSTSGGPYLYTGARGLEPWTR